MNKSIDKQKRFEELLKKKGIKAPKGTALVRRDDPGPYKLSFAQRRIWFLQQFDTASGAYNDPTALRITGPLNIPVLEKTLNEIIRRHQALRMIFPSKAGDVTQAPHEEDRITIDVSVLANKPGTGSGPGTAAFDDHIREFVNSFSGQPFDLGKDMPIKAALLKIDTGDYVLVVNIHHIVLDGWSKGIMLQELMTLYEAFSRGQPSPLPELPIQYTDYVHWHHQWMKGKISETQLRFWTEKLKDAPPLLEMPTDFPRGGQSTGRGSLEPFSFSKDKLQALNELARREDVTLFMALLTAFNILLYRYSGQEDILIGTPVAGRQRVELENLIGLFLNTLIIRSDLSCDPTSKELLARVRAEALASYANQDIPFEKLVEELNPQRSMNITPLFQVMFQLQNAPMPPAHISGLEITPIQIDTGFAQVDLSLTLWEEDGIMNGTFEYNTDLFTAATITRMIDHFQVLTDSIIAHPDRVISRLPIMTEEERRKIAIEWNDTARDYPETSCVYELLEECARTNPCEDAVVFDDERLSYARLDEKADRLSRYLRKRNTGPETLVAICMENSLDLIAGVTGILKSGAAYIPMDPAYPDDRLIAILKDARPAILITHAQLADRFADYEGGIICVDAQREEIAGVGQVAEPTGSRAEHAACVIYTSGSTGAPKGILMTNRNIVNLVYSFIYSYEPGPGDSILPLNSIASASFVGEILPMLTSGGRIVLADKVHFLDMKKLTALMSDHRVTILSTVPSMIARLNAAELKPRGLRLLLSGGETLSAADMDKLRDTVTIVNGYGLTEATICSTYIILDKEKKSASGHAPVSVGSPIINTKVYILDKNRNPVPIGVPGEIYIGGHGLSRGYLNNPELTAKRFGGAHGLHELTRSTRRVPKTFNNQKFCSNFFKSSPAGRPTGGARAACYETGDLGCWLPDGTIKFLGRIDSQVQIHGHRIELSEIETHLGLHPGIRDVVVAVREVVPGDKRLVAYIVPVEGEMTGSVILRQWLDKRVPDYMIPAVFQVVGEIPLNANGKVEMAALPEPSWDRPELAVDYKAPQTKVEKAIALAWQDILHVDKVGINDNFFDLGGHSLLLTRLHSRLSESVQIKKELHIVDLFRYPTIRSLAGYIETGDRERQSEMQRQEKESRDRSEKQRRAFSRFAGRRRLPPTTR